MALIKDYYNSQFGITIQDCYWKIEIGEGMRGDKLHFRATLSCFKDKATADTNTNKYDSFMFEFIPDLNSSDNFIKQAYLYVKTLPEFSGAVDA